MPVPGHEPRCHWRVNCTVYIEDVGIECDRDTIHSEDFLGFLQSLEKETLKRLLNKVTTFAFSIHFCRKRPTI